MSTAERMVAILVANGKFLTTRRSKAPWVVLDGYLYRLHDTDAVSAHGPFKEFCTKRRRRGMTPGFTYHNGSSRQSCEV
jgi:Na+-transporting NADH:ubiquinone oxidoreductase subunit NqrF